MATDSSTDATGDTRKQGGFLGTAPLPAGTTVLVGTLAGVANTQAKTRIQRSFMVPPRRHL
jgi:hypothetical protein